MICFWIDKELINWKEGDCQVICGRVRYEGFLCRDKLKYRVLTVKDGRYRNINKLIKFQLF